MGKGYIVKWWVKVVGRSYTVKLWVRFIKVRAATVQGWTGWKFEIPEVNLVFKRGWFLNKVDIVF